jgi:hypothetical protein
MDMIKDLKRGDRVKFLNDVGVGTVTRLIDKEMVMVKTEDGFEYPVLRSELISSMVDEPGSDKREVNDNSATADDKEKSENKAEVIFRDNVSGEVNIFFAVVPYDNSEPVSGDADIFLINDSQYNVLYHVSSRFPGLKEVTISAGIIDPDTKLLIGTMHLDDLFGEKRAVNISTIPFGYATHVRVSPFSMTINPGKEFVSGRAAYTENDYTDEDAYIVKIADNKESNSSESAELLTRLNESLNSKNIVKESDVELRTPETKIKKPGIEEVDLHIGEIVESTAGLSSGEILKIQLDRFKTSLEGAIKARQTRVVYIHGTGEGKLKHEIRRVVDSDYPRCRYQDASFKEYGYGATMVLIK